MSPVNVQRGTVRRYTRRSMTSALSAAGLDVVEVRYANSLGLICYYAFTSLLRRQPKIGGTISFYDRLVVPVVRFAERLISWPRPPFGQSVFAVGRVKKRSCSRSRRGMSQSGERTVVVEGPPPPRTSRSLERALKVVNAGPVWLYRAALALAGGHLRAGDRDRAVRAPGRASAPAAEGNRRAGPAGPVRRRGPDPDCRHLARAPRRAAFLDRLVAPDQRAAIWLALAVWFPFLLIAAYYRCKATLPSPIVWISFGFMDKRWVTATYLLGALAPMLVVVAAARVLAAGRAHPPSWRAWFRELGPRRGAEPDDDDVASGAGAPGAGAPRRRRLPARAPRPRRLTRPRP